MSVFDKLIGQVLLEVIPEAGNSSLRFSGSTMGVFSSMNGSNPSALVGRSVVAVGYAEGQYLELQFLGGAVLRIQLPGPGPEAFSLHFLGGPIVVG
jgi:hypothetical protein